MGQKEILISTYKNKKIFLTGHTGFKGSWLSIFFNLLGAKVSGYSLEPKTRDDLFHFLPQNTFSKSTFDNILNYKSIEQEIISFQPDFIFHLAAQPVVRESFENPVDTFAVNTVGTANVLEALRKLNKPCAVIVITTDKVYENFEWVYPYRENDRLGGYDPYSASKACAELVTNSFRLSFFNPEKYSTHQKAVASARAGNVIGGGDWTRDRIIPDVVRSLMESKPVPVRNPNSIRPWQHVADPLIGYLMLGAAMVKDPTHCSSAWNFGPLMGEEVNVESLVKIALEIWGNGSYEKPSLSNQPHEATYLKLDVTKALAELKWHPLFSSAEAVSETMLWYREFVQNKANIGQFTFDSAKRYFEKI